MNSTVTNRVRVASGGNGVVAHLRLHALGSVADALGLGLALSSRIDHAGERAPRHDRGKVLVQMALVLAGGGESCADVEHLRVQRDLFGLCLQTRRSIARFTSSTPHSVASSRGPSPTCARKSGRSSTQ